ncbi:hypothetical protein C8J57DRAFT_1496626 [Mycena rebaudengoi]|nr:hypothetical protein C8J57DRAFT_1496626 [Mycena rebaudengoi]
MSLWLPRPTPALLARAYRITPTSHLISSLALRPASVSSRHPPALVPIRRFQSTKSAAAAAEPPKADAKPDVKPTPPAKEAPKGPLMITRMEKSQARGGTLLARLQAARL